MVVIHLQILSQVHRWLTLVVEVLVLMVMVTALVVVQTCLLYTSDAADE